MKKKGRERGGERERREKEERKKKKRKGDYMKINVYLIFKEVIEDFYVFN